MQLLEVIHASPFLFCSVMTVLGLIVGSFLNVVIHRLPIMMEREWRGECSALFELETPAPAQSPFNLLVPRSRCPHCGHLITAVENLPIVSYLVLRWRCGGCHARISPRYPLIELITGVVTWIVAWHFGFGVQALMASLLTWALIALAALDFDTQLLPDAITLPWLWLGLLVNLFGVFVDIHASVIGAMAGYLSLWSVYWLFKLLTGKEGMGYGDFKLLALLGAWLGWQALPMLILLASMVGAVTGLTLIALKVHDRTKPIPFGPYLACAGWVVMIWGEQLSQLYNFQRGVL